MIVTKMLLDTTSFNLFLQNFGSTYAQLLYMCTSLVYANVELTSANISTYLNLLSIWPSSLEYKNAISDVHYVTATCFENSYFESLTQLYKINPTWYAFDYLHLYYIKTFYYKNILSIYAKTHLSLVKPVSINIFFDIFGTKLLNKWSYALTLFGLVFYLTHLMKFRLQYGFNFFFNYFKLLTDIGEQECGSFDDFQFFLFLLVYMLVWYCWVLFVGYMWGGKSTSSLNLATFSIMCIILFIPTILIWNFGLAFGMYIRGAANSANLIVEAFFDIIGVIIVYTRFVVQNIRFLLVFVAYFELFEWVATSPEVDAFVEASSLYSSAISSLTLSFDSIFNFSLIIFKICFIYLYHLLHLIIVSFMQIGVYFMVSFWLFFFLYTSFFKVTLDSYFSKKR